MILPTMILPLSGAKSTRHYRYRLAVYAAEACSAHSPRGTDGCARLTGTPLELAVQPSVEVLDALRDGLAADMAVREHPRAVGTSAVPAGEGCVLVSVETDLALALLRTRQSPNVSASGVNRVVILLKFWVFGDLLDEIYADIGKPSITKSILYSIKFVRVINHLRFAICRGSGKAL